MRPSREEVVAREQRWSLPAGIASLAAVAFVAAAIAVASQAVGGSDGDSELLRNVDAHQTAQLISSILQAIGVGLLAIPLFYLFRAAEVRSDGMRGQLIGVVVAGPLFLAVLAILSGISTVQAANEFVSDEVPRLIENGVGLGSDRANDLASDTIADAPLRSLAAGFGLGGQLGFVIGMFYTAMHAMRTGLLTRFWGSLGMALAAVSFLFFQFTLLWFIYIGLLIAGWVPGGRPPAWAEARGIPWPTPGEEAASRMGEGDNGSGATEPPLEGEAAELPQELPEGEPPRKRKQRD